MFATVTQQDSRFASLERGHNLRFPAEDSQLAGRILLCSSAQEAAQALQAVVAGGIRPTVRSGGHCYEGFVANNPGGAILDLSLFQAVDLDERTGEYCIAPGTMLGDVYARLYKRYGVTLPAGTCYTVGAGGHISGGGYGLLSRLHGLTSDWLSAVDILTVDADGLVHSRRVDRDKGADLFRAMRGAGGGNFGVITGFRFATLPKAPHVVAEASLGFAWNEMSEDQFAKLLAVYGDYWETRGQQPDTWGLFAILVVGARGPNSRLSIRVQFCEPDGEVGDLSVLHEFFDRFRSFQPVVSISAGSAVSSDLAKGRMRDAPQKASPGAYTVTIRPWLEATLAGTGTGGGARAKYKSAYMKRTFLSAEANSIYRFYSGNSLAARSSVISIDSYGGAINKLALALETGIAQRSSVMKLQWQCYWRDASEDAEHLRGLDELFTAIYTGEHVDADHQGTPWGDRYEGCYMNYADCDMLRYPYWPQLFYGRADLYPFLQRVKQKYDPNNIFHHAMSVRPL